MCVLCVYVIYRCMYYIYFIHLTPLINFAEAFFAPYLGHGESVRILDAELGTLQREHMKEASIGGGGARRRGVSRRELSSKFAFHTILLQL